ncbi:MAG: hypothetical protein JWQ63_353 [Mucilaginibacter sp.]|jgi:hypothetical protein|nr:hypothetical protein [Mucilaginibacter sp.]
MDEFGVYNISSITIETEAESRLLIMDVPIVISQPEFY